MLSSGHGSNIAIRTSQQFCLHWGRNNTGPISSQSWMGRDSLGATVSQELLAIGESLRGEGGIIVFSVHLVVCLLDSNG